MHAAATAHLPSFFIALLRRIDSFPATDPGTATRGLLAEIFQCAALAYREGVGITPAQSVESAAGEGLAPPPRSLDSALLDELGRASDAAACGLERDDLHAILLGAGAEQNFGAAPGVPASPRQQAAFFRSLRLPDLVLAQACAQGRERAWERLIELYRQPLLRAAIAIAGSETAGRDLADQLYAELYGLTERDGERRCPLASYRGRGSLLGWLRTTLAQRHVDHYRRTHREQPLDELAEANLAVPQAAPDPPRAGLAALEQAVAEALAGRDAESRFLLAAYYLDGRTLLQIARLLRVHEATVSRKLRRVCEQMRKQILRNLEASGLSPRAAREALGADPRDLDMNLGNLLQLAHPGAFQEKAER
jgi:RNA polymerase sigma-70 factor (ECF subfamily)